MRKTGIRRLAVLGAVTALLSTVLVGATTAPANADLFNPRQDWQRAATAGLFLHWGLRTTRTDPNAPPFLNTDCAAWENEVTQQGWSADKWVNAALKLHASYIVLATFHSRLGYARPWPSAIPGSCSTKRDFLGELISAAKAKSLHVMLYMTDDPKWFWEGLQPATPAPDPNDLTKPSWFDSAAFSAYAGHQVNLNTRPGFGEYSYDNFFEVMKRYPDLAGFWIDNLNQYWMDNHLFEQIRAQRPDMLLSNNNEDTPLFDTVSNEQKTGMTPPYDYNSALWTSMPRLTESDYKLPTKGNWWYDGDQPGHAGSAPVDYKLSIGRLISNVGASSKALEDETSKENGDFPQAQEDFNNFMSSYLTPIWRSINGVEGGGYMYGGLKPGAWNDGAYGFTTISKTNPNVNYVHVVDPPTANGTPEGTLALRDNGYVVWRVRDVRTGQWFRFHQGAGTLTIEGITTWDPYDTVFEVDTLFRFGEYPHATATASASTDGHDASALTDHSYLNWWENGGQMPATITLDLGFPGHIAYLAVNQREWSSTQPRVSFGHPEDSARIKGYSVDVSRDGTNWDTVITCATMPSARAVQFIDLGVDHARYVRLTILSNWSAPNLTQYFNQLKIDEMWLGFAYPWGGQPARPSGGAGCPTPPAT